MTLITILSFITILILIALSIIGYILIKLLKNVAPESTNKLSQNSSDSEILSLFLDEVQSYMYSKKLFPLIKPTDHDTLAVLHQNPNTTDTFVVIDNIIIPSEKKGSFIWKKCMADAESEINNFIKNNKDKIILEEMVND